MATSQKSVFAIEFGSSPPARIKVEPQLPQRQRITQPKDANIRFSLTLNGFIINYLREKQASASTEELLNVTRSHLTSLRRIDGSQYKPTFTRVFLGTLERCPAFKKSEAGWLLDETESEVYKKDILRHIYRRLTRSTRKVGKCETEGTIPLPALALPEKTSASEPSVSEEPEDECPIDKFRKLLQVFPGYKSLLHEIASEPKA